jgi:hypothetical protein
MEVLFGMIAPASVRATSPTFVTSAPSSDF